MPSHVAFSRFLRIPGFADTTVYCRDTVELCLRNTCFRPGGEPLAGNFLLWRNFNEVFADGDFVQRFCAELPSITNAIIGSRERQRYFSVTHSRQVGWSSTAPLTLFEVDDLEPFGLNRSCTGLRVKQGTHHLAMLTYAVTFSCDFMRIGGGWSLEIFTVYPGISVGPLRGEISQRTGQAFFSFTHPGVLPDK